MRADGREVGRLSRRRNCLVRIALALSMTAFLATHGTANSTPNAPPQAVAEAAEPASAAVDLQGRLKDVELVDRDGAVFVRTPDGGGLVRGDEWLRALHDAQVGQRERGFFYVLFNITKPWSFAWIAIGFAGQALFTMRMVLQWYASEKEKRSVIPVAFWWGSLFGGILLFVYFVWRKDIVGIVGQSTGIFVYARNLVLIHRQPTPARPGVATAN